MGEVVKINGWATVFATPKPEKQVIVTEKSGRSLTAQQGVTKKEVRGIYHIYASTLVNVTKCCNLYLRGAGRL